MTSKPSYSESYTLTQQKKIINQVMRYGMNTLKDVRWKIKVNEKPRTVTLNIVSTRGYDVTAIMIRTIERLYDCSLLGISSRQADYPDNIHIHIIFDLDRNKSIDEIDKIVSRHLNIFNDKSLKEMK
jgi:hypothetical protein